MDARNQSSLLLSWAEEAGFSRSGIALLRPHERRGFFLDWLASGAHAGMAYLARRVEARIDPRRLFEGARSVLCVSLRYDNASDDKALSNDLWKGVARYARAPDYHDVMGSMLDTLSQRIERAFPGSVTRWYVDTGPVLERELAAAAGLGAVGKNTCLLHPEDGSWFLIGEVFLSLDLEPTSPMSDLCGTCSRCLEACPTAALTEAYRLDSNRCISYWTIEHRGDIPREVRKTLGEWTFGCDICQEVCPLNDGSPGDLEGPRHPSAAARALDLTGLLQLEVEGYRRIFRGSAMKRAKLSGLKRNAVLAMANSGDQGYVPALLDVVESQDEDLRRYAAWALGRIGEKRSIQALERVLAVEPSRAVREEISMAIEELEGLS